MSAAPAERLTTDEEGTLNRLYQRLLNARTASLHDGGLDVLGRYYDADRYMRSIGLNVPPGYEDLRTVIAWPAQAADTIEERLDVEGIRTSASGAPSEVLWNIWQASGLDEESQLAHADALIYGRSYVVVGTDHGGAPVITVESPLWMAHERDPLTRQVRAAARFVQDPREVDLPQYARSTTTVAASLFLPGQTVQVVRDSGGEAGGWVVVDRDVHGMPQIPVVPLVNRPRVSDRAGRSEMLRVIPVADACCRAITNMQIATEFQAVPQRYILGASREDFEDADGNQIPAWEAYLGRVWALANDQAKAGQFPAAELHNFAEAITTYGKIAASLQGVPLSYFAVGADNPSSADAIRAEEARLVKACERRQRAFGGPWEQVMRLAIWIAEGGTLPQGVENLAMVWRDPATPTMAAKADYVSKMISTGVFPPAYGPEALGLPVSEQERIAELWRQADPASRLAASLDRASRAPTQPPANADEGVAHGTGQQPPATG
ncbi:MULTISPECIES: phage portal protein [unclassified Streptomyces]|uniref:phage portal protein n=1 Tax=unclassified Streptomyces TaxID=2593676 RepID=UPI0003777B9C|nr:MULTISPECIES: phage portal protein [unclassified Streptomyces]MYT30477.1 phage portal protein [Streptomyces sp. SID8354]